MIEIVEGDITALTVEAIVNAAAPSLLGGGGVDGAIHRAAGPGLLAECRTLGGCETGDAKITGGHDLHARYVIHTVGPVWHDGTRNEARLLASCYERCFALARREAIASIAFPAISTGAFHFPPTPAAAIAVTAARQAEGDFQRIVLCCFSPASARLHRAALAASA